MNARRILFTAAAIAALAPAGAALADDAACKTVKLSDVGWTDITSTTALAGTVLTGLGYEPKVDMLSVAVTFESLKNNQVNLFLGNWMPSQTEMVEPYLKQGVELVGTNLADAKVTLAVNREAYEAGVKDFADLQKFADKFGKSIYSIEPGSSANKNLSTIIEKNEFGLGGWNLVEASEQAMLAQVDRATRRGEWVVFLGWAPHPMNIKYKIDYLSGGDAYFGPNYGGATVRTLANQKWLAGCPNVKKFAQQLVFDLNTENQMMSMILDEGMEQNAAARKWLSEHPELLTKWLDGVTTIDGKPGLEAVKASLKSS
ncbi:choline ABC transporter substrate-binding protein [Inquilinus sp. Marseille-Q2685]|uniref:choline ABC transporter substrate-binding protein n=1 Tax=Inquilinus sp. Marseille-Q2685 TaxID=2866581 RepID=UPI001CE42716|nr:choline ABC transporter substrate-binding protein [Inquilinus sp. Marseille-Q2685]